MLNTVKCTSWKRCLPDLRTAIGVRDRLKTSTSSAKGNSLQRGRGSLWTNSYFLDGLGDVDLKNSKR